MHAIIYEVDYDTKETLTGHFVVATAVVDIYEDDNDVSESPAASGSVIGTGKNKRQAYRAVTQEIDKAIEQLTAQKGSSDAPA